MKYIPYTKNCAKLLFAFSLIVNSFNVLAYRYQEEKSEYIRTEQAEQADGLFWYVFGNGDYDSIPLALNALTAAYIADPEDSITAAHIGGLHLWKLSEQERLDEIPATITDHIILSRKYLQKSIKLNRHDARYLGQMGAMMMAEGQIDDNSRLQKLGFRHLLKSRRMYPEFNNFTMGYLGSRLDPDSRFFKTGLEYQWKNLDICIGEQFDRENPDMSIYMHLQTTEGRKRVCWNSMIAPHNFEGFFLNMGDMLVKSGDWEMAQKIYANARLSADYNNWHYRDLLEERIIEAEENVALFNAPLNEMNRPVKPLMSQSTAACTGCHQN